MLYKQASRTDLQFQTVKGLVPVNALWNFKLDPRKDSDGNFIRNANTVYISDLIKDVKKVLKKNDDDELSFLESTKVVDTENQLRFDILKDVYLTRKKEEEDLRDEAGIRAHNQKILALIQDKEDEEIKGKSVEELRGLLK